MVVNNTKRSERITFAVRQRLTRVESNGQIARDEGIARKSRVLGRIRHDHGVRRKYRVGAKGQLARRFSEREAFAGLEPLPIIINERQ